MASSTALRRVGLVLGVVVPVAAYVVLRAATGDTTTALAVTEIIPVAWVLAGGLLRRHVNPVVLVGAAVLGAALLVTVLTGGSALPLKLRRASITGPLGIACLISAAVGRPLLPALLELLVRAGPERWRDRADGVRAAASGDVATVLTVIVGLGLIADAALQVTLALTVSTTVFLAASRLGRIAIAVVSLGACAWYSSSRRDPEESAASPEADALPESVSDGG